MKWLLRGSLYVCVCQEYECGNKLCFCEGAQRRKNSWWNCWNARNGCLQFAKLTECNKGKWNNNIKRIQSSRATTRDSKKRSWRTGAQAAGGGEQVKILQSATCCAWSWFHWEPERGGIHFMFSFWLLPGIYFFIYTSHCPNETCSWLTRGPLDKAAEQLTVRPSDCRLHQSKCRAVCQIAFRGS